MSYQLENKEEEEEAHPLPIFTSRFFFTRQHLRPPRIRTITRLNISCRSFNQRFRIQFGSRCPIFRPDDQQQQSYPKTECGRIVNKHTCRSSTADGVAPKSFYFAISCVLRSNNRLWLGAPRMQACSSYSTIIVVGHILFHAAVFLFLGLYILYAKKERVEASVELLAHNRFFIIHIRIYTCKFSCFMY